MWVRKLRPWVVTDAATDLLDTRKSPDWFDGDSSIGYGQRLQDLVADAAWFNLDIFGGMKRNAAEHLGALGDWLIDPNTGLALPGHVWRWTDEFGTGGQSTDCMLKLVCGMGRTIEVFESGAAPIPVGFKVVVPFKVELLGYAVCGVATGPGGDSCAVPSGFVSQADAQRMAEDAADRAVERFVNRNGNGKR